MVSLLAAKSHCFLLAIILAAVGAPFLGTATHSSHGENTLVDGDEDIETLMSTEERSNTSASQRRYGKGCYFLVFVQLLEKYGTFIARCNALIEKVSSFSARAARQPYSLPWECGGAGTICWPIV
eukprot:SAG31_NODE_47_length_30979_cov_41.708841_13_plen_125_part_00